MRLSTVKDTYLATADCPAGCGTRVAWLARADKPGGPHLCVGCKAVKA